MSHNGPFRLTSQDQTHIEMNGRRQKARYKFGLNAFTSVTQMKELVKPNRTDGKEVPKKIDRGSIEYEVLHYSLEGSPSRGEYPGEDPEHFKLELRTHPPSGSTHYGWCPVWSCGLEWPYWSYQHGFGGDYHNRVVKAAMRHEVYDQIEDCRWGTGKGMHVHHVEPNTFNVLAHAWLGINGLFTKDIKIRDTAEGLYGFEDRRLAESWQLFHAENAELEVVTPEEHRALHAAKAGLE